MDGADEDMDLETVQAQIDMSLAFTNDLVSGWMKASKTKLPSPASRGNDEKELEEHMRRPPRLGVGASIPESSCVHSRETAKLRNKLVGNERKRSREEDVSAPGPSAIVISDDEEESRTRVITKKARLDPFAPKQKGRKKAKETLSAAQPTSSRAKTVTSLSKPKASSKISDVEEVPRPAGLTSVDGTALSIPTKRKKKKKHKIHARARPDAFPESSAGLSHIPSQLGGTSTSTIRGPAASTAAEREVIVIKDTPPPEAPPPSFLENALSKLSSARLFLSKAVSGDSPIAISTAGSAQASPTRPQPPKPVPQLSAQRLDPFGNPLLNLNGPPPDGGDEEVAAGSSKKKRKKRKKKKKYAMTDGTAGREVIDVDVDGEHD